MVFDVVINKWGNEKIAVIITLEKNNNKEISRERTARDKAIMLSFPKGKVMTLLVLLILRSTWNVYKKGKGYETG